MQAVLYFPFASKSPPTLSPTLRANRVFGRHGRELMTEASVPYRVEVAGGFSPKSTLLAFSGSEMKLCRATVGEEARQLTSSSSSTSGSGGHGKVGKLLYTCMVRRVKELLLYGLPLFVINAARQSLEQPRLSFPRSASHYLSHNPC